MKQQGCETYADHRLSSPRIRHVGQDLLGRHYRTVERTCEFDDCRRVFTERIYGADQEASVGELLEHLTTAGGEF